MRPVIKKILLWVVIGAPALLLGGLLLIYLSLPHVADLLAHNPRATALMLQRFKEAKNASKDLAIRQQWVSFDEIPKLLKETIRVTEDAALDKSIVRKIKEYLIARRLENRLGKNRIFELYLNVIEFGFQVSGVR